MWFIFRVRNHKGNYWLRQHQWDSKRAIEITLIFKTHLGWRKDICWKMRRSVSIRHQKQAKISNCLQWARFHTHNQGSAHLNFFLIGLVGSQKKWIGSAHISPFWRSLSLTKAYAAKVMLYSEYSITNTVFHYSAYYWSGTNGFT